MVAKNSKKPHPPGKPCNSCSSCRAKIFYGVRRHRQQGFENISPLHVKETLSAIGVPEQETPPTAATPAIGAQEQRAPLLPSLLNPDTKTVFLDLDETLVCATIDEPERHDFVINRVGGRKPKTYYVLKRPGVDEFLEFLGERFEVVLFTSGKEKYASPIVDQLDRKKVISHRLYRDSCRELDDRTCTKDLSETGRDLEKVVIVDDNPRSFKLQPENAIQITPFEDDMEDKELRRLIKFFKKYEKFDDLRKAIRDFAPSGWKNVNWDSDDDSPVASSSDQKASSSSASGTQCG